MDFQVTILGSGSAVPTGKRNPTSQLIECAGRSFLMDCGEGTQMQLRKFGVKFQKINQIFISHLHGDHYFGLVGLLSTMHLLGRNRGITIFAPKGLKKIVEMQLMADTHRLDYEVKIVELEKNTNGIAYEDEKSKVTFFPLKHKIPTFGYRFTQKEKERKLLAEKAKTDGIKIEYYHRLKKGENIQENGKTIFFEDYTLPGMKEKSYAFCSDTAYKEAIIPFIQQVDLLYHEATFLEKEIDRAHATLHSTAKEAGKIAQLAKVKKLVMGHLSARYDHGKNHVLEAKAFFPNCEYVKDGESFII